MTLRALFAKQVYIKLAGDDSAFICTVQRGPFRSKPTEVALDGAVCPPGSEGEPCSLGRAIFLRMRVMTQPQRFFR